MSIDKQLAKHFLDILNLFGELDPSGRQQWSSIKITVNDESSRMFGVKDGVATNLDVINSFLKNMTGYQIQEEVYHDEKSTFLRYILLDGDMVVDPVYRTKLNEHTLQWIKEIPEDRMFFPRHWNHMTYYPVKNGYMMDKSVYNNDQIPLDATHIFECGK